MQLDKPRPLTVDELSCIIMRLMGNMAIVNITASLPAVRIAMQFANLAQRHEDFVRFSCSDGWITIGRGVYHVHRVSQSEGGHT